ncbi:MAG: hypothetical protein IIC74_10750 [Bacteroidetes bacterium]|nr:hypothetical protein [Bacteroidota bacterium]
MNNKLLPLLTLVAGFLIGKNWEEIEKFLKPYLEKAGVSSADAYSSIMTFMHQQKENLEDVMAESKIKKNEENTTEEEKKVSEADEIEDATFETLDDDSQETSPKISKKFIKERIQQIIKEHPEGILLKKIAEVVDVHFVRLSYPVKELLEKNKIRKEGKLYFPIN